MNTAPDWARRVFSDWLQRHWEIVSLVSAAATSMTRLAVSSPAASLADVEEVFSTVKSVSGDAILSGMKESDIIVDVESDTIIFMTVRYEAARGFPLLYGQAVISLWDTLERFIYDFVAGWIQYIPNAAEHEAVRSVKVSLADYEALSIEERYQYIVDQIVHEKLKPPKRGKDGFEALLDLFSLAGPVDADETRTLLELHQVRNALVHRNGQADLRLVRSCPWMGITSGEVISLDHHAFTKYSLATQHYVNLLEMRVLRYFDIEPLDSGA